MTHLSSAEHAHVPYGAASPVPTVRRALAPDLARGVMLLFIALTHTYLFTKLIGGEEVVHTAADQVVAAGTIMFAEYRGYPMFAALFGYGLAQIHRRQTAQGQQWPWVRALLRRRSRWMIVFGLVHVALLFFGDILAVYGLVALILMGALRWRDRTLVRVAVALLPVGTAIQALITGDNVISGDGDIPNGFGGELGFRVLTFAFIGAVMLIVTAVPFLLGILAARHRLLEEPQRHLRVLRGTGFLGVPLGVLGGLPLALIQTGMWTGYTELDALIYGGLHHVGGYACGLGYAALIALAAVHLTGRQGSATNALAALGQRSMTFYLAQSVVWTMLFASYTIHFELTSPAIGAGIALGVWLATVVMADMMRRRGLRGPAEVALRRLTYGRSR